MERDRNEGISERNEKGSQKKKKKGSQVIKTTYVHEVGGGDGKGEDKDKNGSVCSPLGIWVADAIANRERLKKTYLEIS